MERQKEVISRVNKDLIGIGPLGHKKWFSKSSLSLVKRINAFKHINDATLMCRESGSNFSLELVSPRGKSLAWVGVNSGIGLGKGLELTIETIQGEPNVRAELNKIAKKNGKRWSTLLADAIIKAAYEEGFQRVLLVDIRFTKAYKEPWLMKKDFDQTPESREKFKTELDKKRQIMRDLYDGVRKECNFTKEEWRDGQHYFVREFP